MSDELEDIKRRKLMELQARQQESLQRRQEEQQQLRQQIEQLEELVKQFLSKEALERYGNLKMAHQEKAIRVLAVLGQMIQSGQLKTQINDEQFREILRKFEPEKKDFKITRI